VSALFESRLHVSYLDIRSLDDPFFYLESKSIPCPFGSKYLLPVSVCDEFRVPIGPEHSWASS